MNDQQTNKIESPCISNCCLDDDDICVGCFRHIDEITGWHSADDQRKQEIINNTQFRRQAKQIKH